MNTITKCWFESSNKMDMNKTYTDEADQKYLEQMAHNDVGSDVEMDIDNIPDYEFDDPQVEQ